MALGEMNMDYYEKNAKEYVESTKNADMSAAREAFLRYMKKGGRILDLGCGSGRDLRYFLAEGYEAEGLEPCKAICAILSEDAALKIHHSDIQSFVPEKPYHGIWACASLLHLTGEEFMDFFSHIGWFLLPGGILYFSGKKGIQTGMASDGRYFLEFSDELMRELFEKNSHLKVLESWESEDVTGRRDFTWRNVIVKYNGMDR